MSHVSAALYRRRLIEQQLTKNNFCPIRRIGGDWAEICEQPELKLSSTLEFNPQTTETVHLPLNRPTPKIVNSNPESETQSESTATVTTENTDAPAPPTESDDVQPNNDQSTKSNEQSPARQPSNDEPTHSKDESPVSEASDSNDKFKTAFVFSIENIPGGCYYLTHPNKYVFPGSTHTWYGSGDPDVDREGIFDEDEDDDDEFEIGFDDDENDGDDDDEDDENDEEEQDDDDDVEDCDEDKCETESSTNNGENSNSNDVVVESSKPTDYVVLRKRIGSSDIVDSVSPVKQPKPNAE